MPRRPQITIAEQQALFASRSAAFALTPEEKANLNAQPRVATNDTKFSTPQDVKIPEGNTIATTTTATTKAMNAGLDFRPATTVKPKKRTEQLVSLLDEQVKMDRLKRENKFDELKKLEDAIRKRNAFE
jgi:hypothetical protein